MAPLYLHSLLFEMYSIAAAVENLDRIYCNKTADMIAFVLSYYSLVFVVVVVHLDLHSLD